jgi:ADP-ribosylglycohydrolase
MTTRSLALLLYGVPCAMLAASATEPFPSATVRDKIRGGLLGQILGDLNGLQHEMKYIGEPGNVTQYTPSLENGAWTDDDTDVEWIYVVEMERSGTLFIAPERISELWKSHINRRIWCSNLYVRQLMDIGLDPPLTGQIQFNPWADFNLSGQFLSETWGLIAPGMPRTAARLAHYYTRVAIDLEPAQAARMFAAMIATAFLTGDLEKILDAGAAAADPKSLMRRILADVRRWHRENPADWRATRRLIQQTYGHHDGAMRDRNGVELNGASTIAALLYGRGDFVETVRHAFNFGWDADNNAATSGTIIGVIQGERWFKRQGWNIKDVFRNTSRDNMPRDETITKFGDRLIALAGRIGKETPAGFAPLPVVAEQTAALRARFRPEVESEIAAGDNEQTLARAAYLAICLDLAPELKQRDSERWAKAVAALEGYPKALQALFHYSDIPGAEPLRRKMIAAGVRPPPRRGT